MQRKAKEYDFSILRDLRNDRKITLEKLAEATGISFSTLARIEANTNLPNLTTMKKLADFFGLAPAHLLELATAYIVEEVKEQQDVFSPVERRKVDYAGISLIYSFGRKGDEARRTHTHEECYQVTWVLDGHMELEIHNHRFDLRTGQSLKFDASFEHRVHCIDNTTYMVALIPKRIR